MNTTSLRRTRSALLSAGIAVAAFVSVAMVLAPGLGWAQEKAVKSGRAGILALQEKRPARNAQQYFSRGRQVVATLVQGTQGKIDEYSLVNSSGKRTLHLQNIRHSSVLRPSPAGDYAVGWTGQDGPPVGPIFYNGKEEKKADSWPERTYVTGVVFSSNGDRVAVSGGGGTFLYRRNGSKIAELPASRGVAFSASGKFIVVAGNGALYVYAADGQKKGQATVPGLTSRTNLIRVANDGIRAVYATSGGEVGVVDILHDAVEWRWNAASLPTIDADVKINLNGLDATSDLQKIVVTLLSYRMVQVDLPDGNKGTDPQHINDYVVLLDAQGHLLDDIALPPNGFIPTDNNAVMPELSQKGKQLQVERKSGSFVYSIK